MSNQNIKSVDTRRLSIRSKILVFIILMVVISNLLLGMGAYFYTKNLIFEQVQNLAMSIAENAAAVTDGDELEQISDVTAQNDTVIKYSGIYGDMTSEQGAEYIYSFMPDDRGNHFFVATSDIEESADSVGEEYEMYPGMELAYSGRSAADEEPTTDEWGTFLSGYAPVYNSENDVVAIVGADINYSELLLKVENLRTQIFLMYFVIAAILILGCLIISNMLKRGFFILNSKVVELADGSGDINREVELHSGDEFETIAGSINCFIGEVRTLAENVAKEAKLSADTVTRINDKVTELSANIEECSATSECISDRLENTSNNVLRMSDTVSNIDRKVSAAADSARNESITAMEHKENATTNIQRIQSNVREAARKAGAVDQVRVMATEIRRIASESRILALNAQIEAARAGDAGMGFAVVAGEMEALNDQITNAVTQIAEINDTVVGSVNELIQGTNQIDKYLTEKVLPDYDEYARLGREYGEMAEAVSQDMSNISDQAKKLSEEVQDINQSVHDISRAVTDSANQVSDVSSESNEIVENMSRLTDSSLLKMVN